MNALSSPANLTCKISNRHAVFPTKSLQIFSIDRLCHCVLNYLASVTLSNLALSGLTRQQFIGIILDPKSIEFVELLESQMVAAEAARKPI